MAVSIEVNRTERGLVVHFDEPAMKRCLYGFLCNFEIQYRDGISSFLAPTERPKEEITDLWLSIISSNDSVVAVYVVCVCKLDDRKLRIYPTIKLILELKNILTSLIERSKDAPMVHSEANVQKIEGKTGQHKTEQARTNKRHKNT